MALSTLQWDDLKARYQAGIATRILARIHAVDESTIRQKARRFGWQRDPAGDRHDMVHSPTAHQAEAEADDELGDAGTPDDGSRRQTRADRHAAKQRRFDELTAILQIALSEPVAGDALAAERRAEALAAVRAEGGMVAALSKASKLVRRIAAG
ncbi:hypothetical protein JMJ56_26935 [Belnapia sp. T18]|uniref:Terminase small subunit n=1 Tax=Belnapia arida TaxID=2804533 RepID=A0ABS1UAB1_9PROT|nr:hypothetical protein [Belnapia arida]MBL6081632.1 hypothetical protein [Belnapia arida]